MAIVHEPRVDVRLHMLFWHLADRWGRVRGNGTLVPFRFTHAVLAGLVAAWRPSVSTSLSEFAERGAMRLIDSAWVLSGEPPGELLELQDVAVAVGDEPETRATEERLNSSRLSRSDTSPARRRAFRVSRSTVS
jgi:hypothetical protein